MRGDKTVKLERLFKMQLLLHQNPGGLTLQQLAGKFQVSERTIRRDLQVLDSDPLRVPIVTEDGRYHIGEGYFLPPIHFTVPEAMTIFVAARLILSYSNAYNQHIDSAFWKLQAAVPQPLRAQVAKTMQWMQRMPRDEGFIRNMNDLTDAWINGRRVRIWYQALEKEALQDRDIDPYFIQPAAMEHATYVIAYCHRTGKVLTFKVERIRSTKLLDEHYTIPKDFDANKYLGSAWGISVYGKTETIKLRFNKQVGRIAQETKWHPSQVTEMQPDGSAIVSFRLAVTYELASFVTWWGDKVEVLQPLSLRDTIKRTAREILKIYDKK